MTSFAREVATAAVDAPQRPVVQLDDHTLSYRAIDGVVQPARPRGSDHPRRPQRLPRGIEEASTGTPPGWKSQSLACRTTSRPRGQERGLQRAQALHRLANLHYCKPGRHPLSGMTFAVSGSAACGHRPFDRMVLVEPERSTLTTSSGRPVTRGHLDAEHQHVRRTGASVLA